MTSSPKHKIVINYSGGLDSLIMRHYAQITYPDSEIVCIYYKHGAASEAKELSTLPDYVQIRTIDWLNDKCKPVAKKEDPFAGAIYIPGRNLIFASLAACQELANEVWMGTVWDEDNPKGTDKNEHFRSETSNLLSYVLSPFVDGVKVRFPFVELEWTKVESVRWALANGLTKEEILNSVSCWEHTDGKPCGQCKQCVKRALVFKLNGFSEECKVDPLEGNYGLNLLQQYLTAYVEHPEETKENRDENNVINMIISAYYDLPEKTRLMARPFIYKEVEMDRAGREFK